MVNLNTEENTFISGKFKYEYNGNGINDFRYDLSDINFSEVVGNLINQELERRSKSDYWIEVYKNDKNSFVDRICEHFYYTGDKKDGSGIDNNYPVFEELFNKTDLLGNYIIEPKYISKTIQKINKLSLNIIQNREQLKKKTEFWLNRIKEVGRRNNVLGILRKDAKYRNLNLYQNDNNNINNIDNLSNGENRGVCSKCIIF